MYQVNFDEVNKVWISDVPPAFNINISFGHILLRSMRLYGPKIAQINDNSGERFTFADLRLNTVRAAQNLLKRGYKTGQVFGFVAANPAHLSSIVFASMCLGCPINPLHSRIDKISLIRMFEVTEPRVIFCDIKAYDLLAECLKELGNNVKVFTFDGVKGDSEPVESLFEETGIEEDFVPTDIDGINHVAAIISSSGTTGKCKGISISHASLISCMSNNQFVFSHDIMLSGISSIHWVSGLIFLFMGIINGATRIESTEDFSPKAQLRLIEEYKVTALFNQGRYLVSILKSGLISKENLSSIRLLLIGGTKVPISIRNEFIRFLPNGYINNAYGLSETTGPIVAEFPGCSYKDAMGRLLNGNIIKIIDDDGNKCGINVEGEICVSGRHKFLGYFKDEELTKTAIDSEGFFLTGDIGYFDEDGYLFVSDRKKDVILSFEWVFPSEVEEILLKSNEIDSVCVVGVPYDSAAEVPAAIVIRARNSTITEEAICKMVADNMADHCKLRGGVYFVDSIPTTSTGKPLRRVLKEFATELYKAKSTNDSILER